MKTHPNVCIRMPDSLKINQVKGEFQEQYVSQNFIYGLVRTENWDQSSLMN